MEHQDAGRKRSRQKQQGTALLLTLLMVLTAVFGIGGFKLRRARSQLEKSFYQGENSIMGDLQVRADAAANLLAVAKQLPAQTYQSQLEQLEAALQRSKKAEGPQQISGLDREVEELVIVLAKPLEELAQQEGKKGAVRRQVADFESAGMRISKAAPEYNQRAENFNHQLQQFPASVLKQLWNVEEAQICQ